MSAVAALKLRWAALAARERSALLLAGVVLLAALVWSVLLGPALLTLRDAALKNQQLDREFEQMQRLQARAQALQAEPALAASVVEQMLQGYVATLGKGATLQLQGEQATLTLVRVPAQNLAQWLADVRAAKLHPGTFHLQRDGAAADVAWSGSIVFQLPAAAAH